jgi:hypothetical protein
MTSHVPNGVKINRIHTGAICEEIGERLRASPAGRPNRLPARIVNLTELLGLMERFESVECGNVAIPALIESAPR